MVIEPSALILLALLVLTLPLNWLLAALTAAGIHELGHILSLIALGGRSGKLRLCAGGAVLEASGLTPGREALCALAGPLCGALLTLSRGRFPRLALCAGVQTLFNLIPIRPLDGGRILGCLFALLHRPHWQGRVEAVLCVLAFPPVLRGGLLPLAVWLVLVKSTLGNLFPEKFLAK